ncbi:cAMP-specific 3',5'-cyclic phosphodiesterase, putative, partial [Eimeria maxima]
LTYADEICLVIGCISHDVGHPGLTNQYLINCKSPLAITYNDISVLENYHAACCFRTAAHHNNNIFKGLSKQIYQYIRQHTIELILATDMKQHFDFISHLRVRRHTPNFNIIETNEDRWMVFKACIKAADLAHAATNWDQHKQWSERLAEEFYLQGDEEKRLGLPVSNLCDRMRKNEFSRSQAGFLKVLVEPLFTEVAAVVQTPEGKARQNIICKNIKINKENWDLIDQARVAAERENSNP